MQSNSHLSGVYRGPSVGIGRPVSTKWLDDAVEKFDIIAPGGVILELRTNPAITYVTPEEIEDLDCKDDSLDELQQVKLLLGAFAVDPLVYVATATERVVLNLTSAEVYIKQSNVTRLQAKLQDKLISERSHQYTVEAEKTALRSALGLRSRRVIANQTPWHWLKLGLVKNQVSSLNQHEMQNMLNKTLSRAVPLEPVSSILL